MDRGRITGARQRFRCAHAAADPAIVRLNELLREYAGDATRIVRRSGLSERSIRNWFSGRRGGNIHNVRAVLNTIGYDIAVVKISKWKGETP